MNLSQKEVISDAPTNQDAIEPIELDRIQRKLTLSRTNSGYRRIKGAAGSGKTLVLACRAAELAKQGNSVLVLSFNISLTSYLSDLSHRWLKQTGGEFSGSITFLHFHGWCKTFCLEQGYTREYNELWHNNDSRQYALNVGLPKLVLSIINDTAKDKIPTYDAIMVDEGQDFLPDWWNLLRKVRRTETSEMLLVADATQDIYERSNLWTDQTMKQSGFTGAWHTLNRSYRLPLKVLEHIQCFAEKYLPAESINIPISFQYEIDLTPCHLKWIQTTKKLATSICREALLDISIKLRSSDDSRVGVTFLTDDYDKGNNIIAVIPELIRTVSTFEKYSSINDKSKKGKERFYGDNAHIKATTLHSFKGLESRAIVILVGESLSKKSLTLLYTGLTRLKRHVDGSHLTVICTSDNLKEYGQTWPEYHEVSSGIVFSSYLPAVIVK